MIVVLICAVALVAALGIFNYVIAVLKSKGKTISPKVYSVATVTIIFVTTAVVLVLGVVLLRNPQAVFTNIHWGWVLGSGIVLTLFFFVVGVIWLIKGYQTSIGSTQIVLGGCILTMMIFGLCLAHNTTYKISTVNDLNLLDNLPSSDKAYRIEIVNDIDFKGAELKAHYGNDSNIYFIYGNGYTWKNINYEASIMSSNHTFLSLYASRYYSKSNSRIYDLTIEDSEFYLTPNCYSSRDHEGKECNFYLISTDVDLDNVTIDITVYIKEAAAIDNIRYETKSYINKIYPMSQVSDSCNINVNIVREDEN